MSSQIGYYDTLKSVAGKVFTYLASITLTGTDGKAITVTEDTTLDEAVAMSDKATKTSGIWTPDLKFGGLKVGITYSTANGKWTQIGNIVFFDLSFRLSNKGSSVGDATISIPSVCSSVSPAYQNLSVRAVSGLSFTAPLYGAALSGTATLILMDNNSGAQRNLTDSAFVNTTEISITGFYFV